MGTKQWADIDCATLRVPEHENTCNQIELQLDANYAKKLNENKSKKTNKIEENNKPKNKSDELHKIANLAKMESKSPGASQKKCNDSKELIKENKMLSNKIQSL